MTIYYMVYQTTNLINGRKYIGVHKTHDLNDRYLGSNQILKHAITKYGRENFKRDILCLCNNEQEMFDIEYEIVNAEWISDPNTYNLAEGGRGWNGLGSFVVDNGIGIHAASFEQRSKWSSDYQARLSKEERLKRSIKGGKKSGRNNYINKTGLFNISKERRSEISRNAGITNFKNKLGMFGVSREKLSEWGSHGNHHKGFRFYNDGTNTFKYTPEMMKQKSFDEFMKENPQFEVGRSYFYVDHEKSKNSGKSLKGSKYYNDGEKNYRYTIKQQKFLSFGEFMKENPQFEVGCVKIQKQKKFKKIRKGMKYYNDGIKNFSYKYEQQQNIPFEKFMKDNPKYTKGRIKIRGLI